AGDSAAALAGVRSVAEADSAEVAAVPDGNVCPQCQQPVASRAKYCPACGAMLRPTNRGSTTMRSIAKVLIGVIVLFVVLAVLAGGCIYRGYVRAVNLDEQVRAQWAQVDNQLQRRYDLIPNAVETVKGTAAQEQQVFLGIAEARKAYFQADSVPEKAQAAGRLESALSRLLVLRETYPELRSNEAFRALMDQLEGTENRLAVERMRYNEAVAELNRFIRQPIGRLYASLAGVDQAEYFEIDEAARSRPQVDFSTSPRTKPVE
ncbi:MAG TPA: LemA family protein, partial [Phycisphaerae bacterium]|nr:LemA family protein [Phycisphaerae bacterium]